MTDLIKGSVRPWSKADLIARLLAEETDLTDCAADYIEQTEAKLTKAVEERDEYKSAAEICGKAARAMLAELEEKK